MKCTMENDIVLIQKVIKKLRAVHNKNIGYLKAYTTFKNSFVGWSRNGSTTSVLPDVFFLVRA